VQQFDSMHVQPCQPCSTESALLTAARLNTTGTLMACRSYSRDSSRQATPFTP
jgi:hypothetical protein